MDKNIPVLNELRSKKKEELQLFFADNMFSLMQKYFRKFYVIRTEKNKILVFQTRTWNTLARKNLKARVSAGWLEEVPDTMIRRLEAKSVKGWPRQPVFKKQADGQIFLSS